MNESFVFYRSFHEAAEGLNDEQYGKLMRLLAEYALNGTEPEEMDAVTKLAFTLMKPQIDANSRRRENGSKGGKPKNSEPNSNLNVTESEPNSNLNVTESEPNVNANANANANDNDNIKEKVLSNESTKKKTAKRFVPPTTDEVRAYCLERHNTVNADAFMAFYESNGWKVGKNSMKDWKAAVRTWEQRESRAAPKQDAVDIWLQEALAKKEVEGYDRAGIPENSQYAACVS